MLQEVIVICLLIFLNGLLSMAEIAIATSRKTKLEQEARKGTKGYKVALKLANDPNKFLSTVQIGITSIGILTGIFSGQNIQFGLQQFIIQFDQLAPYAESLSVVVVVLIITFLSLVFGELIPKRLGYADPERIASNVAQPMLLLSQLSKPMVKLLGFTTDIFLKLFGIKDQSDQAVSEEELKILISEATEEGHLEEEEKKILNRVFHLGDRKIASLMTYRNDIAWLDVNKTWNENKAAIITDFHKAYPLCDDELDKAIGFVYLKDILPYFSQNEVDLKQMARKPLFVPEGITSYTLLNLFKENQTHTALVIDEYGSIEGIISLNDLSEMLVGEVNESAEGNESEIVEREDGSWYVDASLAFEEFIEFYAIDKVEDEEKEGFNTLGGFIINFLGHIPTVAEQFYWRGLKFEIADMDGNRIDKVLVEREKLLIQNTASED